MSCKDGGLAEDVSSESALPSSFLSFALLGCAMVPDPDRILPHEDSSIRSLVVVRLAAARYSRILVYSLELG